MLALRRARMAASPPFLRGGFRPFFLLGALWAALALTLWLLTLSGAASLPTAFDPLAWHRHEMLFGFVGAVVAGFLLTAIPNWTGRLPIAGLPLAMLAGLWAAGRIAMLFSASIGPVVTALLDVGFYLVLGGVAAREVLAAKNRNVPLAGIVLLLGVADALDHAGARGILADTDLGVRAAIGLIVVMISLVGGRIVPSFTRNWMARRGVTQGLPSQPARFDIGVVGLTAIALLAWTAFPESRAAGGLLAAAGLAQALRLFRWGGWRTVRDPLVVILHIGYLWIPIGLLMLGASNLGVTIPRSTAIHALTAGAMATMILAVMTRASLGHTGRELVASLPTVLLYACVTLGAALRVAAGLGMIDYTMGINVAGAAWVAAFGLFVALYGPILARPRLGEG